MITALAAIAMLPSSAPRIVAQPFDLADVRVTGGPFAHCEQATSKNFWNWIRPGSSPGFA